MKKTETLGDVAYFPLHNHEKRPHVKWATWEGDPLSDTQATGLGIDCGRSNLYVIDVDMHGDVDGISAWAEIEETCGDFPPTFTVMTPSGGLHYYYLNDGDPLPSTAGTLAPGVDTRGKGGYIVAPHSAIKVDGEIETYEPMNDLPPALLPSALRAYILSKKKKASKSTNSSSLEGKESSTITAANEGDGTVSAEQLAPQVLALLTAGKGQRNSTLNKVAFELTLSGASLDFLQEKLAPIAVGAGLGQQEINKTLESAHEAGTKKRQDTCQDADENGYYSELVMSDRFALVLKAENWCYIEGEGRWMRYDNKRGIWKNTTMDSLIKRTKDWCHMEVKRAVATQDKKKVKEALPCFSRRVILSVADLVRLNCIVDPDIFDQHRTLINCENGVIDLRGKGLLPHSPSYYFTRSIPLPYDHSVKSKHLDAVLDALPEDSIEWFISIAGQALTAEKPSNDKMFFMNGIGANGKSTILNLLAATIGDYGGHPSQNSLVKQKGSNDEYNLMMYRGLHQAIVEEMPDKQLDTGRVKMLTGTEVVTARKLYKDQENFVLNCTIFVSCNILPQVTEYDHGSWRRIALIPFSKVYRTSQEEITKPYHRLGDDEVRHAAKGDRDTHVEFFTLRVDAAREWYARGMRDLPLPPSVIKATEEWRVRGDNIRLWFNECLKKEQGSYVLIEDLRDSYNAWLQEHGYVAIAHKSFVDRLSNHEVFMDEALAITRSRVAKLTHSPWEDPGKKMKMGYTARTPGVTPTHVKDIAFR